MSLISNLPLVTFVLLSFVALVRQPQKGHIFRRVQPTVHPLREVPHSCIKCTLFILRLNYCSLQQTMGRGRGGRRRRPHQWWGVTGQATAFPTLNPPNIPSSMTLHYAKKSLAIVGPSLAFEAERALPSAWPHRRNLFVEMGHEIPIYTIAALNMRKNIAGAAWNAFSTEGEASQCSRQNASSHLTIFPV